MKFRDMLNIFGVVVMVASILMMMYGFLTVDSRIAVQYAIFTLFGMLIALNKNYIKLWAYNMVAIGVLLAFGGVVIVVIGIITPKAPAEAGFAAIMVGSLMAILYYSAYQENLATDTNQ